MTTLSTLLLLAVAPAVAADANPTPPTPSAAALGAAAHQSLRKWAKPAEADLDRAARELLATFQQVQQHPQMARDSQKELLVQLRSRLLSLSQQLAARLAKASRADAATPQSGALPQGAAPALAQRAAPANAGRPQAVNAQPYGALQLTGDASQELIDVIQRTIAPHSWDINGGPGAIVYWRPGMALVIRQTQENHEAIGGLIVQLEKAGP